MGIRILKSCLLLSVVFLIQACASGPEGPTAPDLFGDVGFTAQMEGKLPKIDICHVTGNGSFRKINVNENSLPSHLSHGDSLPGENGLDQNCELGCGVRFTDIEASFGFGLVDITWSVEGTATSVEYFLEGSFDGTTWFPISSQSGTGQGDFSGIDFIAFDFYRVRSVCPDGTEVVSDTASLF